MFSPELFRNHFSKHQDFAKGSKFEVRIQPPQSLIGFPVADLRFQCEAAELPGYSINTVDNRIYGVPNPVAATAAFSDVTLTFICAGDMWEKKFFDSWMQIVIPSNNYNVRYKDDYASRSIEINQYSEVADNAAAATKESQVRYSSILHNAFPVSLAPIGLNWADDGILRLAVTFKYEHWTRGNDSRRPSV